MKTPKRKNTPELPPPPDGGGAAARRRQARLERGEAEEPDAKRETERRPRKSQGARVKDEKKDAS